LWWSERSDLPNIGVDVLQGFELKNY